MQKIVTQYQGNLRARKVPQVHLKCRKIATQCEGNLHPGKLLQVQLEVQQIVEKRAM